MPKETRIKKNKRSEVRQQDVFEFGPKIEVAARPVQVDTSVRAKNVSGGSAAALLDGLGLAGDLVGNFAEAKKVVESKQMAEGQLSGAKGDTLNADATTAFIKGHEMATGMGAVANFNNLMVDKHKELVANEASPSEYQSEMSLMERDFLSSGSDAYTEGAIRGGALETQKNLSAQYAQAQFKRLQAKGLYNINGIIDGKFAEIAAMPSETTDDQMRQAISARNVMSAMQELGMEQYNLDRNQVNASVVKHLAPIAQAQGNPSLFAFAFVEDGTGQKIINTAAGDAIYSAMDVAENQRRADIKTAEDKQEKAEKQEVADAQKSMSIAFASGKKEDIVAASQELMSLRDIMTPAAVDGYIKDIQDFASGFGYAEVSDMEAYSILKSHAGGGTLTYDRLRLNKDMLEPSHFKEVLDKMLAYDAAKVNRQSGKASPMSGTITRSRATIKSALNTRGQFGGMADPFGGPKRAGNGGILFDEMLEQFSRNEIKWIPNPSKRAEPDHDQLRQIKDKVLFKMYDEFPMKGGKAPRYEDPETKNTSASKRTSAGEPNFGALTY